MCNKKTWYKYCLSLHILLPPFTPTPLGITPFTCVQGKHNRFGYLGESNYRDGFYKQVMVIFLYYILRCIFPFHVTLISTHADEMRMKLYSDMDRENKIF